MREYDPVLKRLLPEAQPEVEAGPGPEFIWRYQTEAKAQEVAEAMTQQNREGRQAAGSPKRRYYTMGTEVWAAPMDP